MSFVNPYNVVTKLHIDVHYELKVILLQLIHNNLLNEQYMLHYGWYRYSIYIMGQEELMLVILLVNIVRIFLILCFLSMLDVFLLLWKVNEFQKMKIQTLRHAQCHVSVHGLLKQVLIFYSWNKNFIFDTPVQALLKYF